MANNEGSSVSPKALLRIRHSPILAPLIFVVPTRTPLKAPYECHLYTELKGGKLEKSFVRVEVSRYREVVGWEQVEV